MAAVYQYLNNDRNVSDGFSIQKAQNKDSKAIRIKLNKLIAKKNWMKSTSSTKNYMLYKTTSIMIFLSLKI